MDLDQSRAIVTPEYVGRTYIDGAQQHYINLLKDDPNTVIEMTNGGLYFSKTIQLGDPEMGTPDTYTIQFEGNLYDYTMLLAHLSWIHKVIGASNDESKVDWSEQTQKLLVTQPEELVTELYCKYIGKGAYYKYLLGIAGTASTVFGLFVDEKQNLDVHLYRHFFDCIDIPDRFTARMSNLRSKINSMLRQRAMLGCMPCIDITAHEYLSPEMFNKIKAQSIPDYYKTRYLNPSQDEYDKYVKGGDFSGSRDSNAFTRRT